MNYQKIYENFMKNKKFREYDPKIVYEQHHILPKSLGGLDHPSNLIYLTIREHYIAHLLLYKIYKNEATMWALQWFVDSMSPAIKRIFFKNRKKHSNRKDWCQKQEYKIKQQEITTALWNENEEYKNKQKTLRSTEDYKQQQKERTKETWKTRSKVPQDETGKFKKRKIMIDGIVYDSFSSAAKKFNINNKTVKHRGKSKYFPNWNIVD